MIFSKIESMSGTFFINSISAIVICIILTSCSSGHDLRGKASWYGKDWHGRVTASGEIYDMNSMTAAHKTLPLGAKVLVRDLTTGKTVKVRINNRGPYVKGRIIDLSRGAAEKLGILDKGITDVEIVILEFPKKE